MATYGSGVQRVTDALMQRGGGLFGQGGQYPWAGGMGSFGNPSDFRDAWSQMRSQFLGGPAAAATAQPTPPGWATPWSGPPPGTGMDTPPAPEIAPPAAPMATPWGRPFTRPMTGTVVTPPAPQPTMAPPALSPPRYPRGPGGPTTVPGTYGF